MTSFDDEQAELIYKAELAHFRGFRSTSLSGPYAEDLLLKILQKHLPKKLKFGKGIVVSDNDIEPGRFVKIQGRTKGTRRPQIDIIVYRPDPKAELFREDNYCVINSRSVLAAIEVKKWITKSEVEHFQKNDGKYGLWKNTNRNIPFFLVGFRMWKSKSFDPESMISTEVFLFSKSIENEGWASKERGLHIIDIQERSNLDYLAFIKEKALIAGELERLIKEIKTLAKM